MTILLAAVVDASGCVAESDRRVDLGGPPDLDEARAREA